MPKNNSKKNKCETKVNSESTAILIEEAEKTIKEIEDSNKILKELFFL